MVSVVIPAFEEMDTVASCVRSAQNCPGAIEVIVVDDGSSDGTADAAEAAGATVIRLTTNSGKAAAMNAGVRAAKSDVILFLDADVTGFTPEILGKVITPVVDGRYEMYVGVRARQTIWLNRLLHFFPILGGTRAITRRLWDAVPNTYREGFKIEIALNHTAKQFERKMGFELISGTQHHIKEKKYGLGVGIVRRLGMIADIVRISFQIYIWDFLAGRARRGVVLMRGWLRAS